MAVEEAEQTATQPGADLVQDAVSGGSGGGATGTPAGLQAPCAGADELVTAAIAEQARAAAACLVNQERARGGLAALTVSPILQAVGQAHAQDMIDRDFFAHDNPSGQSVLARIRASSYLTGASNFSVGENLALAAGPGATPRALVAGWMASPGHRANILNPSYREAGMGLVPAVPRTAGRGLSGGVTLAQEFGLRR